MATEAAAMLTIADLALRLLPFRRVAHRLGQWSQGMDDGPPAAASTARIKAVRQAIMRAQRRLPWAPACLAQAIAGRIMLGRRGVSSTIHFGVSKVGGFRAHAWLVAGDEGVTGVEAAKGFTQIARMDHQGRPSQNQPPS
ncbi:lasso peptide biosynthesis B2 protein [Niveispirillum sp.]|uniref:lasso peptide biosynthesis B2 protein n=1 Tax=Niveispirillum sp. TaxID=1917217 RepID=UPI001B3FEFA9|nr:lasso peptide biosynthesis B2 protein [Niveispirillum sp.]MBP7336177.1 lasso peptide biosynthesis B2 protein [Niveispirillum sp.]